MSSKTQITFPFAGKPITIRRDILYIGLLIGLWWLFFWRIFTPNPLNQQSLVEGDFSGQFVAYAGYQAAELSQGHIPLWDPFNNSGTPFLADTQSAALYPPRLITLALVNLGGTPSSGVLYSALELEMAMHVLLASLGFYAFVRQLTAGQSGTFTAGVAAGLTFAYGGFLTGYAPLQLAILEAAAWLPLILFCLRAAISVPSRMISLRWFIIAGTLLGISFLAGHPQTELQILYLCTAYLAYRIWRTGRSWQLFIAGIVIFGIVGVGIAAGMLLPGLEFSRLAARSAKFTFDSQGNGFPLSDIVQFLFPSVVSQWSPLYFGVAGLALALLAVWKRADESRFWLISGLVSLVISFGQHTVLYDAAYNLLPGFSLFREQERAALLVAACGAVLAGLGTNLITDQLPPMPFQRLSRYILGGMFVFTLVAFTWYLFHQQSNQLVGQLTFSVIVGAMIAVLFVWTNRWRQAALIALIAFELFTVGHSNADYESKPALARLPEPPLIQQLTQDQSSPVPYRVDGARGLFENYGTLYGVQDIQGISPLRISRYDQLLTLPRERVWELLAVRYVLSPDQALPIASSVVGQGNDKYGPVLLHRLNDPRPFARLVYRTWIEPTDDGQLKALANPDIDLRHTVILGGNSPIELPDTAPVDSQAQVISFAPESFTVQTSSSTASILDLSAVDYPGWLATIDGQSTRVLNANYALMAVALSAGSHIIVFTYQPPTVTLGSWISLIILVLTLGILLITIFYRRRTVQVKTTK